MNAWRKMRTLMPFLWPKKSFALQFRVCFCICLLIGGRFINVFVPIYNQKIGKFQKEDHFEKYGTQTRKNETNKKNSFRSSPSPLSFQLMLWQRVTFAGIGF